MASEIERLIDMLGCGNTVPQERIRWARSIVDLARSEGVAKGAEQGLNMAQRWIDSEFLQGRHVISLPHDALLASVLAPTKERP